MVNRPILEIEVDDSAFKEFLRKFNEYQDLLKGLPDFWKAAGKEIEGQRSQFEKIRAEVAAAGDSSAAIEKSQDGINKLADGVAISFGLLSHGKHFASNIHKSTQSLMKCTKLTSVFGGFLGAGGLYGIDRMAASVAGQRTSATGLGVSYGERASFLTNFGPLGNPEGILQGFSAGLADPVKKTQIAHLLGHKPTGDAAERAAEALLKFKDFVTTYSAECWISWAILSLGLTYILRMLFAGCRANNLKAGSRPTPRERRGSVLMTRRRKRGLISTRKWNLPGGKSKMFSLRGS
jgi:hypothetical protein